MLTQLVLFAQEGQKQQGFQAFEFPLLLLAMFALLYFVVILPGRRRQEKERQDRLSNLLKNDKVLTAAGIYGTVADVSDKDDVVTVKVDDNVRIKMTKASIVLNISQDERAKADKEKQKAQKAK